MVEESLVQGREKRLTGQCPCPILMTLCSPFEIPRRLLRSAVTVSEWTPDRADYTGVWSWRRGKKEENRRKPHLAYAKPSFGIYPLS